MTGKTSREHIEMGLEIRTLQDLFEQASSDDIKLVFGKLKKGDIYTSVSRKAEYEMITMKGRDYILVNGTTLIIEAKG